MARSYEELGAGYAGQRHADARIAALIHSALGDASSIVNVGAGTGSYEPDDRLVLAVEPSARMISQRPRGAAVCVRGWAEALPVASGAFDVALALLTIHHWSNWRAGLNEMRRVARRRIVLLTFDAEASDFWLTRDYFPELNDRDREVMPTHFELASELPGCEITPVPVPHDCTDGFLGAYWRRPHQYLNPLVRGSMSPFAKIDAEEGLKRLARDLDSGAWHRRNADLLERESLDVGYRIVRGDIDTKPGVGA